MILTNEFPGSFWVLHQIILQEFTISFQNMWNTIEWILKRYFSAYKLLRHKWTTNGQEEISKEAAVSNIHRKIRRRYSAGEKIRIFVEGLRGESKFAELSRREGVNQNLYHKWGKEFLEPLKLFQRPKFIEGLNLKTRRE